MPLFPPHARAALIAVAFLVTACPLSGAVRPDRHATRGTPATPEARASFDEAFGDFTQERWAESERGFARFLTAYPTSALAPEARFRRGVALNRLGEHDQARLVLRDFLERHPTSSYVHRATVELSQAELALGNRDDAEQILRPVVDDLSDEEREALEPVLGGLVADRDRLEPLRQAADAAARAGDEASALEFARMLDAEAGRAELLALQEMLGERHPATVLVSAARALLLYHLGDVDKARELAGATRARTKNANDPSARLANDALQRLFDRLEIRAAAQSGTVGVILPMSGRFLNFGKAVREGIDLALNGRDGPRVIYKDSQADPDLAAAAVEELAREGAMVIIGPVGVQEAAPAAARAQELGIPIVLLSRAEGVTNIGPWVFRNSLTNSAQGRALARFATQELGVRRGAILAPDIPAGEEVGFAFWDELEMQGGEIRGFETYAHDQTTFAPTVKRLVARDNIREREEFRVEARRIAERESDPYRRRRQLERLAADQPPIIDFDVLLVPDFYETVGLLAPALAVEDVITTGCDERELERIRKTTKRDKLNPVVMLGGAGWNHPRLISRGGRYVNCSVFVDGFYADSSRVPTQRFVQEFTSRYQRRPTILEAQGYDTAAIVRDILRTHRPESRDAFRDRLSQVRDFPGATGDTSFDANGEVEKSLFFLKVEKNAIQELDVTITSAAHTPVAGPEPR